MIEHNGKVIFSDKELRCSRTGIIQLAPGFERELKELRVSLDMPMTVNSCCRSKEYNTDIRGHRRSLHVFDHPYWPTQGTAAIDISIRGKDQEYIDQLINIAWYLGWSVGIAETFIHLDRRSDYIPRDNPKNRQTKFWYG